MSSLTVYPEASADLPNKVLTHLEDIASTLAAVGVRFARWQAGAAIGSGASDEEVIAAYRPHIDSLMAARGYSGVEVLRMDDRHPQKAELRAARLEEHCYDEDEVRFFVVGRGLFSLHIDDYVYAVLCEKNDLITIPAGMPRWFDMGEHPHFISIRLFNNSKTDMRFTGEPIAERFPALED